MRVQHPLFQLLLAAGLLSASVAPVFAQSKVEAQARKLLARFDGEPSVNQVQRAALDYASMNPELLRSMQTRSKVAPLLPEIRLRIETEDDLDSKSITRFEEGNAAQDISATKNVADDLKLYGEAKWKFGDVVFNSREFGVVREYRQTAKTRQKLLQTVTQVYFERRRAQVELLTAPPTEAAGRALAELKIAQLTGELDALTGGGFSRMVAGGNAK